MLLNGFDVDTATGTRQVELRVSDLPTLGLDVDLVVVSAFEGDVAPVAGTLLGRLQQAYGIRLDRLACALDLRQSPLKCWVSDPIDWAELQAPQTGDPPTTRFQRIAVDDRPSLLVGPSGQSEMDPCWLHSGWTARCHGQDPHLEESSGCAPCMAEEDID